MAKSSTGNAKKPASGTGTKKSRFGTIFLTVVVIILAFGIYYFYSQFSNEKSTDSARQLSTDVLEVTEQYKDSNGYVSSNNVSAYQDAVYKYVQDYDNGWIKDSGKTTNGVWVKFSSGFTMLIDPPLKGYLSADTNTYCRVSEYRPNKFSADCDPLFKTIGDNTSTFASQFKGGYGELYDYGSVDLDAISNMGIKNTQQIILWTGHGSYVKGEGCYLCLGEKLDWDLWNSDGNDYKGFDKSMLAYSVESKQVAVSPRFIAKYVKNLDGALVYLGACESGYDSKLADAFLKAGADTVVCYDKVTLLSYHAAISEAFTDTMCSKATTGSYVDATKAINEATAKVGADDRSKGGMGSKPVIFGDRFYVLRGNGNTYTPTKPSDGGNSSGSSSSGTSGVTSGGTTGSNGGNSGAPVENKNLTKRTQTGMWFLPAQNGDYDYGSITSAYISGDQLVFIGGGATLGWGQGDGVMMEDQPGANSSFALTNSTTYSSAGSTISKEKCAEILASGKSLDWIQIDVSNGYVTAVYL